MNAGMPGVERRNAHALLDFELKQEKERTIRRLFRVRKNAKETPEMKFYHRLAVYLIFPGVAVLCAGIVISFLAYCGRDYRSIYQSPVYQILGPSFTGVGALCCGASYWIYKYKETGQFRRPKLSKNEQGLLEKWSSLPNVNTGTGFHHQANGLLDVVDDDWRQRAYSASVNHKEYRERAGSASHRLLSEIQENEYVNIVSVILFVCRYCMDFCFTFPYLLAAFPFCHFRKASSFSVLLNF